MDADDILLFRTACKNTRPLKTKGSHRFLPSPPKPLPKKLNPHTVSEKILRAVPLHDEPKEWHSADSSFSFSNSGLQRKILKNLRAGKLRIEAKLDLHRMVASDAHDATLHFIERSQQQNKRVLLIIHGKGNFSKDQKPVLKSFLLDWLSAHPAVLAVETARPADGGTGAVYVLIKRIS